MIVQQLAFAAGRCLDSGTYLEELADAGGNRCGARSAETVFGDGERVNA